MAGPGLDSPLGSPIARPHAGEPEDGSRCDPITSKMGTNSRGDQLADWIGQAFRPENCASRR